MAIALNQSITVQTGSNVTSDAASFGSLPAAGSLVIVVISLWNTPGDGSDRVTSVTDNQSNTYTEAAQAVRTGASEDCCAAIFYAENVNSSGTFTVTINLEAGAYVEWSAHSFTGIATSSSLDQIGTNTGAGITSGSQPTVATSGATTQADELVVACASSANASSPNGDVGWAIPSGWTGELSKHVSQADTIAHDAAYNIIAATGTQTATWAAHATDVGDAWAAVIGTFKASAGTTDTAVDVDATSALTLTTSSEATAGVFLASQSTLTLVGTIAGAINAAELSVTSASAATFEAAGLISVPVEITTDFSGAAIASVGWFVTIPSSVVAWSTQPVNTSALSIASASTVTLEGAAGAASAAVQIDSTSTLTLEGAWIAGTAIALTSSAEAILYGEAVSPGEGNFVISVSSETAFAGQAVGGGSAEVTLTGGGAGTDAAPRRRQSRDLAKELEAEDAAALKFIEQMAPKWVRMVRARRLAELGIPMRSRDVDDD